MEDEELSQIDISGSAELECLRDIIDVLSNSQEEDPKYNKIKELLLKENWIKRGCIIFSEYFDTAQWIAQKLSEDIPMDIGLYAGLGNNSGIYKGGKLHVLLRDEIKEFVLEGRLKVLAGTDAAGEGLNLQALGTLVNVDLPWNPVRLEQRIGRIRRAGQVYDEIYVYNLFYRDSVEEYVHNVLKKRMKSTANIIGPVVPVLGNDKIKDIIEEIEVDKGEHPFDIKYHQHVAKVDWESITCVLDDEQRLECLKKPW